MALKTIALTSRHAKGETVNVQTTLITAVTDAITAAGVANAVAGAKADVTTKLATVTAAVAAVTANQPTGAVVVTIDTSLVTTKNKLRELLDEAYRHFADAQNILT